jgi:hypothetical protein
MKSRSNAGSNLATGPFILSDPYNVSAGGASATRRSPVTSWCACGSSTPDDSVLSCRHSRPRMDDGYSDGSLAMSFPYDEDQDVIVLLLRHELVA